MTKQYNLKESEEVLEVAYILKDLLVADGYAVCLTRTTNVETLSNNACYTYGNTMGSRVLVSLPVNGSSNPDTDYTTTLHGKWQKDRDRALALFGELKKQHACSHRRDSVHHQPHKAALLPSGTGRREQIAEGLEVGIVSYSGAP